MRKLVYALATIALLVEPAVALPVESGANRSRCIRWADRQRRLRPLSSRIPPRRATGISSSPLLLIE